MQLTRPALVAAIAYGITCFILLLPFDVIQGESYNFFARLLAVLIFSIPLVLVVYSVNCMMVGGCNTWSYIVAILIALWAITFIIMVVMAPPSGTVYETEERVQVITLM